MSSFEEKKAAMQLKKEAALEQYKADLELWVKEHFPNAEKTETGLFIALQRQGGGALPKVREKISVHYHGTFQDGKVFDSSVKRGKPFSFMVGIGNVIQGWDEGLLMLSKGTKAVLIIPYYLGYGEGGSPPVIPAKSTLLFEVEVL
jgi:FKBP-type peptidyl-prolyl cis-trans isomerase